LYSLLGKKTDSLIIYPNNAVIINLKYNGASNNPMLFFANLFNPTTNSSIGFPTDPKNHSAFFEYSTTVTYDPWNVIKIGFVVGIPSILTIGYFYYKWYRKNYSLNR
jgi:hypothetical protein